MAINIRVNNQKPNKLNPVYIPSFKGSYDVKKYMTDVLMPTMRLPMVPTASVDIKIDNNSATDDDIINLTLRCCTGNVNPDAEEACRSLLSQTLQYYNPNTKLLLKDAFAVSAGTEAGLDEPDAVTIYTPATDIIPASSGFLAGNVSYEEFFAEFAYYCRFEAFGVYFVNQTAFDDFKAWFQTQVNLIQNKLNADCLALIADFMKLKLDGLTESFRIRHTETENLDEYCFARILVTELMIYFGTTKLAGLMPFDFENLFCPKNIVFINVERFAHASPAMIANEVKDINQSIDITKNITMISNRKLQQLAPVARQLRKTQAMAVNAAMNNSPASRASRTAFKKRIMTHNEYLAIITKILEKMKTEKMTQNIYKCIKSSFAKPNRRNPDDFNLQGKIVSTKYRPDIHLYLDTSGSIDEENYESSVKLAIMLAKKLNVNLYFNTFSHIMSQTTLLKCAGKSVKQIYAEFQNTPKVTGGTNFEQIWRFINTNKKREAELSIMITDFEWNASSHFIKHPKNLYYMPCANMNWSNICHSAESFVKSCEHNDPNIRTHVLA